jgi:hypothetical protein
VTTHRLLALLRRRRSDAEPLSFVDAYAIRVFAGQECLRTIVEPIGFKIQVLGYSSCGGSHFARGHEYCVNVGSRSACVVGNRHCGASNDEHFATYIEPAQFLVKFLEGVEQFLTTKERRYAYSNAP